MTLDEIRQKIKSLQKEAGIMVCIEALKNPGITLIEVGIEIDGDTNFFPFEPETLKDNLIGVLNKKLLSLQGA